MAVDYLYNGRGHGSVAETLVAHALDTGALRPWCSRKTGKSYITVNDGLDDEEKPKYKNILINANATLTREAWIRIDTTVTRVAQMRMKAWNEAAAAVGLTIPNGMGVTVLQYQTMSDISPATISMDPLRTSERDRPQVDLRNLPLPIIHKDLSFSLREIMVSRNGGMPLDTTSVSLATRRVAEEAEKLLIGVSGSYSYGGGTVYGYTNFPDRITKSINKPSDVGYTPDKTVTDVLDMVKLAQDHNYYGPFVLYFSRDWSKTLGADYVTTYAGATLEYRLRQISNISRIETLDYLTGYQILLVQMSEDVVQAVTGMPIQTVQWESHGGMQLNMKVMGMLVPRLRSDNNNNTGIVHGS